MAKQFEYYHTLLFNEVEEGGGGGGILVSPCPFVPLSICPSVHQSTESWSALYLQQYSPDPFYIYTSNQATSDVLRVIFFPK